MRKPPTTRRRRAAAGLGCALLSLALTGCGGGPADVARITLPSHTAAFTAVAYPTSVLHLTPGQAFSVIIPGVALPEHFRLLRPAAPRVLRPTATATEDACPGSTVGCSPSQRTTYRAQGPGTTTLTWTTGLLPDCRPGSWAYAYRINGLCTFALKSVRVVVTAG